MRQTLHARLDPQARAAETRAPQEPIARLLQERVGNRNISQGLAGGGGLGGAAAETLSRAVAGVDDSDWLRGTNSAAQLRIQAAGGAPLPPAVKARMEAVFGADFSGVRVHTDGTAAQQAEQLQAHAFATGHHIFFGRGAWAPGTPSGDRVLVHELTHVVQHQEGRAPRGGGVSQPTDPHEREAASAEDTLLAELDALLAEGGGSWATPGEELPETSAAPSAGAAISRAEEAPAAAAPAAEGEQKEAAAKDEDDSVWMELIRKVSPELAQLLETGLGPIIEQIRAEARARIEALVAGLDFGPTIDTLEGLLGEAAGVLSGAAAGDPECCEALPLWIHGLQSMAEGMMAFQPGAICDWLGRTTGDVLGWLIEMNTEVQLMQAISPFFGTFLQWAAPAFTTIQSVSNDAADWVASKLGIDFEGDGLLDLAGTMLLQLLDGQLEPFRVIARALVGAIFELPGVEAAYRLVDFFFDLYDCVAWLAAHIDDPDIIAKSHEEMADTWIPAFLEKGQAALPNFAEPWSAFGAGLSRIALSIAAFVDTVGGSAIFVPLTTEALLWIARLDGLAQSPFAQEVKDNFTHLFDFMMGTLNPFNLMLGLGGAIRGLEDLVLFLTHETIEQVPACYLGPILDIVATAGVAIVDGAIGLSLLVAPPPLGPTLTASVHQLFVGALGAFKALPVEDKKTLLLQMVELAQEDLGVSFIAGLGLGVGKGVLGELQGAVSLLIALGKLSFDLAAFLLLLPVHITTALIGDKTDSAVQGNDHGALGALDDLGDAYYGEDEYTAAERPALECETELPALECAADSTAQETTGVGVFITAFVDGLGATLKDLPSIQALVGDLWRSLMELLAEAGKSLMEQAIEAFFHGGADLDGFDLGFFVGETGGAIFADAILIVASEGLAGIAPRLAAALAECATVLKAPELIQKGIAVTFGKLVGVIGGAIDEVWAALKKIKSPALQSLLSKLEALFTHWKGLLDIVRKVLGLADEDMTDDAKKVARAELKAAASPGAQALLDAATLLGDDDLLDEAYDAVEALVNAKKILKSTGDRLLLDPEYLLKVAKTARDDAMDELLESADPPEWADPKKSPKENVAAYVQEKVEEAIEAEASTRAGQAEEEETAGGAAAAEPAKETDPDALPHTCHEHDED